ncbi:MAG: NADP-dependent malic enzyme [Rhodospirillaceae bacterium]|nr:NADP-dependent malic enzyme [Rhodospirillaceae bacterium]
MADTLRDSALEYHRHPRPGKLEIVATKTLANQRDLALAYSPGVAFACTEIAEDPSAASLYTARGNLVAVISNGTAVLGLGAIGPLASKPVMEGKAVLFKKFAGIDVFDIEVAETDPERLIEVIAALEPTFGAINLEDIKAPECFQVERTLRDRMNIPVFHDDQHGTAIIVAAAVTNGLRLVGKKIEEVKLVASGAGAAALACLDLLMKFGLKQDNIIVTDRFGVVYQGRAEEMDPEKSRFAIDTDARTLGEVIGGADIFMGLSAPNVLKPEMVKEMAENPLVLALANPNPEILPELAREARPDAIICTGRSDYPNQVNNVLCFPFIFRGALDVGATSINDEMKRACAEAIADLAMAEASDVVARAYADQELQFGPEYILPKPFDPRLIVSIAPAVAQAAMDSGVATRPIEDMEAYRQQLTRFVFRSGLVMKPVFEKAKSDPKRVVFTEGEEERVLRAAQVVIDEGFARPILIGRRDVLETRIKRFGLRLVLDGNCEVCDPEDDPRFAEYVAEYHALMKRRGVTRTAAGIAVRTKFSVIAALMVRRGEADAMIAGPNGAYHGHLKDITDVIGLAEGVHTPWAMQVLILTRGAFFITDTNVSVDPDADEIADLAIRAATEVRRFGIEPKVALISHSNFGTSDAPSAVKMRAALAKVRALAPDLEIDGEMHADCAVSETIRTRTMSDSDLHGAANLLVMPNIDAANVAYNFAKALGDGLSVGPVLLGAAKPAHIVTPAITVRGIVNMAALTVVDAQNHAEANG